MRIDLCEEGLGFGVPILQYRRDFYFPGSSEVYIEEESKANLKKVFHFNLIERKQAPCNPGVTSFSWVFLRIVNYFYKSNLCGRFLDAFVKSSISKAFPGLDSLFSSRFIKVGSRGKALTQFDINQTGEKIAVSVGLRDISKKDLEHIYVLNELGGSLFTEYLDSEGLRSSGSRIRGWAKGGEEWSILYAPSLNLGFRVQVPQEVNSFYGRETYWSRISWSGVIFVLKPPIERLDYDIYLGDINKLLEV